MKKIIIALLSISVLLLIVYFSCDIFPELTDEEWYARYGSEYVYQIVNSTDIAGLYKNNDLIYSMPDASFDKFYIDDSGIIYIAGQGSSGGTVRSAYYWRFSPGHSGSGYPIGSTTLDGHATSIVVKNNTIHIIGSVGLSGSETAKYWQIDSTNTITSDVTIDTTDDTIVTSLFVDDTGVAHIVGYSTFPSEESVWYWKYNGSTLIRKIELSGISTSVETHSVFVKDNTVYIVGQDKITSPETIIPKLWTITDTYATSDITLKYNSGYDTAAYSIFVSDAAIYITGSSSNDSIKWTPLYWKIVNNDYTTNSTQLPLGSQSTISADAFSVFVMDNTLYIGGNIGNNVCYWKVLNDIMSEPVTIASGSPGYSIFAVKQ